ncbi:MAG: hypothetical protein MUF45_06785 [Spirosomaceae bacterium]|jgi:hypothetical protein|nr:hypothetical protein [Spirosomataceae bacterium]
MRKQFLAIGILCLVGLGSCNKSDDGISARLAKVSESLKDFDCINKAVDKSLTISEVRSKIFGEWQLKGMITMLPTKEVPDSKVIFKKIAGDTDNVLGEYYLNGKLKGSAVCTFKQVNIEQTSYVTMSSDKEMFDADTYNFFRGNIRICDEELMIDNGMAFDAPAYLFRKIK